LTATYKLTKLEYCNAPWCGQCSTSGDAAFYQITFDTVYYFTTYLGNLLLLCLLLFFIIIIIIIVIIIIIIIIITIIIITFLSPLAQSRRQEN